MQHLRQITQRFMNFAEGKGFSLLITLCVGVIVASALYTRQMQPAHPAATPPALTGDYPASALWQDTLHALPSPTPLPEMQPILWCTPLSEYTVLREFSEDMQKSGTTGLWQVHTGADLSAQAGSPVMAMADGVVDECVSAGLDGAWISILHDHGYVSRYASLSIPGACKAGDHIRAGQTIGFIGTAKLDERDLGPHLHLEIYKDGIPIDPLLMIPDR